MMPIFDWLFDRDDLVAIIALTAQTLRPSALAHIARRLKGLRIQAPRGGSKWLISPVQHLLA